MVGGGGGYIYQHISSVGPIKFNEQEVQPVLKLNGIIQQQHLKSNVNLLFLALEHGM